MRLFMCLRLNRDAGEGRKEMTLTPGQTFYEGPSDVHVVGRNGSQTKPAKFVVFWLRTKALPYWCRRTNQTLQELARLVRRIHGGGAGRDGAVNVFVSLVSLIQRRGDRPSINSQAGLVWSRGVARWFRWSLSVADPFVCRCLTSPAMLRFPHPAHRTGRADLPHRLSEKTHAIAEGHCM